jgi:heterodisulfide reductase subunit A
VNPGEPNDRMKVAKQRSEQKVETEDTKREQGKVGAVLVVGGGIAGMQASLDLAESGFKVYLVDASPSIGGAMAQLDKTFPTNDCAMCIMSPKLVQSGRHLNIDVITNAEVEEITGEVGSFEATIRKKARYIDIEKCTGCGVCAQECPIDAINPFNKGLSQQRAVFIRYPQAVPLAYSIDRETCIGCGLCENLCLADAVKYDDKDESEVLKVGAIILAPGFELFDPVAEFQYGYGQYPNVITSLEFERILSASGPYRGMVLRPWDGRIPTKVAFIQCVGSRGRGVVLFGLLHVCHKREYHRHGARARSQMYCVLYGSTGARKGL